MSENLTEQRAFVGVADSQARRDIYWVGLHNAVKDEGLRSIGFRHAEARSQNGQEIAEYESMRLSRFAGCSSEVNDFMMNRRIQQLVAEAVLLLKTNFGFDKASFRVFTDPSDGSQMLFVELMVADLLEGDRRLTEFGYSWWYDRIAEHGHTVGFRVVKGLGL